MDSGMSLTLWYHVSALGFMKRKHYLLLTVELLIPKPYIIKILKDRPKIWDKKPIKPSVKIALDKINGSIAPSRAG